MCLQTCYICKTKGANIRCCEKSCELSFHLTCGLEAGCQNKLYGMFRSYCKSHNRIYHPTYIHKSNEVCTICYDNMGEYHPINSIQSPCCSKNSWYHKKCLAKYAKTSGNSTKCPLCNNYDLFCRTILKRGIYIPAKWVFDEKNLLSLAYINSNCTVFRLFNRTPEWKEYDSFYDSLESYDEIPRCSADRCICWRGRTYEPQTSGRKYSFLFCQCCGAKAIHRNCLGDEIFTCDDCKMDSIYESIYEIQTDNNDEHALDANDTLDSNVIHDDQSNQNQNSNFAEFNIKPLSIVLQRLWHWQILNEHEYESLITNRRQCFQYVFSWWDSFSIKK